MLKLHNTNLKVQANKGDVVPFTIEGVSKFTNPVTITGKVSCGCTLMDKAITVSPNQSFSLSGSIKTNNFPKGKETSKAVTLVADSYKTSVVITVDVI